MTSAQADAPSPAAALSCRELSKSFGGVAAVNDASFDVTAGTVTALIGPNGAGKSTVVNLVSGFLAPDAGSVRLGEAAVTGWPSHRLARAGMIRTFQLSRELQGLTVLENLLVTPIGQAGESLFNIYFRPGLVRREERRHIERALSVLREYGLYEVRDNWARELSGGQKRLLELARAVMASPRLLLLDEPLAGVNPALIDQIGAHILRLKAAGVTVLMVEHNLGVVEQICDHVIVLAEGRTLATGLMSELRDNAEVVRAYLGGVLDARVDG
ncbi:MAG TPA: ABC transporter ATP-binding protein [Streptosporangiaceae bacterium]|nr:ABC transporter ATP-binding protein [Streptosporangiaceae bacterium]